MADQYDTLSWVEVLALLAGDTSLVERLKQPCSFAASTAFRYAKDDPIYIFIESDGAKVRLSDGGKLFAFLETQGLDVTLDEIISRTVFHALREVPGMSMGGGRVFLDTAPNRVPEDLVRFLQAIIEIVGLRHSKYKDALVRLAQRRLSEPPEPPLL